ncbi:uncharacterized protein LOC114928819 [Nylanderia fulva]|uniref:uncharacterized protein LOC114928819 n=1 Tax=Nylanderia fulva TaxID=613905 RepID=UPI0010FB985A|nr:uncharacterized protein LOC114928819 [Nylanderia fulva]
MSPPKSTPKSKRNEKSRRSSILKPRKPRQPFQNVNFDSPTKPLNETNSTPLKTKRRVSFAEKKHVKEFCHSVEQGTVWDNTYEEHDCSLKSSISDSSGKTELTEGASLHISQNKCEHICESNLNNPNNFNLTNNQLSESIVSVQEKDNENCEMIFTNSFKCVEFNEECTQTTLLKKSTTFQVCKNTTLHDILVCNNTDENHRNLVDGKFQLEQNMMLSPLSVSHISENAISSNVIYRDPDEENNSRRKSYSESLSNVAFELDSTCNQDLSMEITAPVPTFLLPSRAVEQINVQKDDNTNYIDNCNNASTQAVKPVNSDLGVFKQIAEIQNRGNENMSVENNTHDKIFSTNLQSNVASENAVFRQTKEATQNIAESMILTTAINVQRDDNTSYTGNCNNASIQAASMKPASSDLGIFKQIAEIQNHGNENLSVENNTHNKMIFSTNLQSNITSENTVFKQTEDATQNIDESMILTTAINIQRDDTSYTGNYNNASTQATSMKPVNSDLGILKQIAEMQNRGNENLSVENNTHNKIFSTNLLSNVTSENAVFRQTEDATQNIDESMILTTAINVQRDDTSYTGNYNNASTQATSMKPVNSDLGILKQIAEMQNRGNENLSVENNTHNKIFSTNLLSNVTSENAVFRQTEDATQNFAESMILTTAINVQKDDNTSYTSNCNNASIQAATMKPVSSDLGIFKQIAEIQNRGNENMSVENNTHTHNKTIFSTNLQSNIASENTVFKQTEDATQNIDESMISTTAINVQRDDNTSYTGNCNNASIQAAFMKPASSDLGIFKQIAEIQNHGNENLSVENNTHNKIFSTNLLSNVTSENAVFRQTEDATQNIDESMILTTAINVQRDDTSYTGNYNNASTQATSMKPVNSDLGILKQIAEMQNRGNENLSVENNTHNKIFSTNLLSNVTSENAVFRQTEDATQNFAESMILTTAINVQKDDNTSYTSNCNNASIQAATMKPVSSDLGIFKQIAEIQNRGNENMSVENNTHTHNKTIFSTNLQSNIASENTVFKQTEDATQNIDESMILTTAINVQRDDNTSYTGNCNNASIQAAFMKPASSDLGIFKQIAEIQNHGNENLSVENNTHNKMIFSTNLQSNITSENTVFKQTEDATQNIDESMILTTAINVQRDDNTSYTGNCNNASIQAAFMKPASSDLGIFKQIAEIQNHGNENLSVENNTHNKMIFSTNLQSNITSENTVFKQTEDATQNIDESMILTTAINIQRDDTSYTGNYKNASTQATSMKPVNSDLGILKQIAEMQNRGNENLSVENNMHNKTIFSTNLQSNIASERTLFKQTENTTRNVAESMTLTTVIQPFTTNNTVFNTSMEMTAAVPSKMYNKIISHSHDENMIEKNNLREDQTDETEFFTDVMMEPVNMLPPLIVSNKKKDLRMDDKVIPNDDRTMFFQDISMKMTNVISKNQEITRPIVHKSISEESTYKEKNMDNSSNFNEKTRSLCKSMEFTEAVPVSLHHERTFNAICTAQSTSISVTTSKLDLPVENLVSESMFQDTVANKTIQHVEPMEITATDLSTLHLRDATDERKSSIISKDNEFQHLRTDNCRLNDLTANNLSESRKNVMKDSYIISREISVLPSSTNNLNHSSSTVLKNISSRREAFEDEQPNLKKFCSSFTESRLSQENNVHLSLRSNDNHVNDIEYNEYSVKDHTMDCSELSASNFRNNLEISECNLFRKSLENNIIELSSIKPPSFLSLDSDKEENSFLNALHEDKLPTDDDETVNNMCNNSNQLIGNNVTEYLAELRTIVNKSNYCTTNAENPNEESVLSTQNEEDDNCQMIQKTIINDEDTRISEPNHTTNAEDCNEENISSTQTVKHGEMNTDHFISPVIKKDEVIDEENIRGRMNDDAEPRNNIKEKEQYLVVQRLEMEWSTDHLKKTEVVKNQSNSEKHCKENLNAEAGGMEEKENCKEERFAAKQCVTMIEDESLTEQDPFLLLLQKLETHSEKDDCIWNVYHKNVDKKTIVFGFISNSLILITTFLSSHLNCSGENPIEKIRIVSRASDNSGVLVRIVHKLILEKLDEEMLMYLYKIHEEVLRMLERVSQDVKLAMDFMFDLKRLDALNLMEIAYNEISFLCRSKRVEIILKVTIKVKRFDKLTSNDISVNCLLGTIKETDVKSLIKNIKKDHKFLKRYMNDIKDYIDIMEETLITKKSPIDFQ